MFTPTINFIKSKLNLIKIFSKVQKSISKEITINNIIDSSEPKWQRWIPFTFFMGDGKVQPLYCFVFIFSCLSACMFYIKIKAAWIALHNGTYTADMITSTDLATVLTFVSSLILLYSGNKKINSPVVPSSLKKREGSIKSEGDTQL